jgi:hypothetical protein
MEKEDKFWIAVRIVLLFFSFLSAGSFLDSATAGDVSKPSISFAFAIAGVSAFGIIFVWLLQRINPWSTLPWQRPSWRANLISREPLLLFHLGAWGCIVMGVGCLVLGLTRNPPNWLGEAPLFAGIGALVGVHLVAAVQGDSNSA